MGNTHKAPSTVPDTCQVLRVLTVAIIMATVITTTTVCSVSGRMPGTVFASETPPHPATRHRDS